MTKGQSHEEVMVWASAANDAAEDTLIAAAVSALDDDGGVKRVIQLMPTGSFTLRDGRGPHTIKDKASAQAVIDASLHQAGAQELFIDFDHQLVFAAVPGVGGTAEAASWIKSLEARDDGIWATVDWTPDAEAKLKQKKYRYISPLYKADKQGNVTLIVNAGLTNNPAINGLAPIAASQTPTKEPEMKLSAFAAALGMATPETATEPEIIAAATAMTAQVVTLRTTLGVEGAGDLVAAATALKTAKVAGATDIVIPATVWQSSQDRLAKLEGNQAEDAVKQGMKDRKITPGGEAEMLVWAKSDIGTFLSWLEKAPEVVPAGEMLGGKPAGDATHGLTADEMVAASALGVTAEEFAKGK